MKIIVCIKQVPATTEVKIDSVNGTLIRDQAEAIINPFDTYALEEAVRLKEKLEGQVVAISMGPPQAEAALREALSLGADEAILLSDSAFAGADTWATAYTLAQAIKKLDSFDIVICGKQTVDGDTGQVGPELAEMLGIPFVTYVRKIEEINQSLVRVERLVEEGYEIIEANLPALITVVKEINEPRLPSLKGMMKAKSAQVTVWGCKDIKADENRIGLDGSPTRVIKIFTPKHEGKREFLEGDSEDKAEKLVQKLKEEKVI